jgi:hypothetical protein
MKMDIETKWVFDDAERAVEELAVWIKEVRQQAEMALHFHDTPFLSELAINKGRRCANVVESIQDELEDCHVRMQQCIDAVSDSIEIQRQEAKGDE